MVRGLTAFVCVAWVGLAIGCGASRIEASGTGGRQARSGVADVEAAAVPSPACQSVGQAIRDDERAAIDWVLAGDDAGRVASGCCTRSSGFDGWIDCDVVTTHGARHRAVLQDRCAMRVDCDDPVALVEFDDAWREDFLATFSRAGIDGLMRVRIDEIDDHIRWLEWRRWGERSMLCVDHSGSRGRCLNVPQSATRLAWRVDRVYRTPVADEPAEPEVRLTVHLADARGETWNALIDVDTLRIAPADAYEFSARADPQRSPRPSWFPEGVRRFQPPRYRPASSERDEPPWRAVDPIALSPRERFGPHVSARLEIRDGASFMHIKGPAGRAWCERDADAGRLRCTPSFPHLAQDEVDSVRCKAVPAGRSPWVLAQCDWFRAGGSGSGSGGHARVWLEAFARDDDTLRSIGTLHVGALDYANWPVEEYSPRRHFARLGWRYWHPARRVGTDCMEVEAPLHEAFRAGHDFVAERPPTHGTMPILDLREARWREAPVAIRREPDDPVEGPLTVQRVDGRYRMTARGFERGCE